jgi:hypothetical protein
MNIAFFLYYRAGSSLFHRLINSTSTSSGLRYLPTVPKDIYRIKYLSGPDLDGAVESGQLTAVSIHVGNWWGKFPDNKDIPGPLESPSPMKWSRKELGELLGKWKFVSLIRDGRNHISSLINKEGSLESKLYQENSKDYFEMECIAFRNKARVALDCSKWDNYRIFRFENLVQDPVGTVMNIFSYLGLEGDRDYLSEIAGIFSKPAKANKHSSFSDDSKMHYRWHEWTSEQKKIFNEIAGKELIDLGYEKDSNWSLS